MYPLKFSDGMTAALGRPAAIPVTWMLLVPTVSSVLATAMPLALLTGLARLVRVELGFGEAQLGSLVAVFFACSAIAAVPGGRMSDLRGAQFVLRMAGTLSAAALLGLGWLAHTSVDLLVAFAVAGMANGVGHAASNHLLAVGIRVDRQGLAFGLKQAAIPLAMVLGGLSLQIAPSFGWRWLFVWAALPVCVITFVSTRHRLVTPSRLPLPPSHRSGLAHHPLPLLALSAAGGLGSAASACLAPFLVEWTLQQGLQESQAGLMLALGGVSGMTMRVASGWYADQRPRGALITVAMLLWIGAAGFCLLAVSPKPLLLVAGVLLAFAGAWGWSGLVFVAARQTFGARSGRDLATVAVGPYLGSVLGPIAFGLFVESGSYVSAWLALACLSIVASALLLVAGARAQPSS